MSRKPINLNDFKNKRIPIDYGLPKLKKWQEFEKS